VSYNAKAQRTAIAYGNGTTTASDYDPLTFRLTRLQTTRTANPDAFASQLFQNATLVQDLRYTYDPIGNITRAEDAALQTIFHGGEQVDPVGDYAYDPLYRLIEAHGREQIAQTAISAGGPDRRDWPFAGPAVHPADMQALRNYVERYDYDPCDNLGRVRHTAAAGTWTRTYDYAEASLIEPAKMSNRLTRTQVAGQTETYRYTDALGVDLQGAIAAIDAMPLIWNDEDDLQQVDLGGGGTAHYQSDVSGRRVRKVIETTQGNLKSERRYLGGFELYREFDVPAGTIALERETLQVADDERAFALVETRTQGSDGSPATVMRYQHGNLLGSVGVELDEQGALIAYEEYHPFGTTAFQASRSAVEVRVKRYRYVGKERDEETGLYYHGARYYAPWLGRWTACDPAGLVDGVNLYAYVRNNSIRFIDPDGLSGEEGGDTPKPGREGAHGEGKEHSNRTRDKHQKGDRRGIREQEKRREKERQQKKEQRKRNPKNESDTERKQRENQERKDRYKKESEREQDKKDKPDPDEERKQQERKERERRFKEEERRARERKERELKEREQREREQREREQREREQREREQKEREQKEREQKEKEMRERAERERRRIEEYDKPLEKPSFAAEVFGVLVLAAGVFIIMRGARGGGGAPEGVPTGPGGGWQPAPAF
jgi:RHS repeat-associated protein